MDEAFLPGGLLNKPVATKPPAGKGDPSLKKEDIDVIVRLVRELCLVQHSSPCLESKVHEFEIPRIQAEKVLVENGGDLEKALRALCGLNIAFANT